MTSELLPITIAVRITDRCLRAARSPMAMCFRNLARASLLLLSFSSPPASRSRLIAVCSARVSPFGSQTHDADRGSRLLCGVFVVSTASAQQQTQCVAGTIDKVEGKTCTLEWAGGPVTLTLADNAVIVPRVKASTADIKPGDYVASGGVPQPGGTPKAVELRIFPGSMRGNAMDIGRDGRTLPTAP